MRRLFVLAEGQTEEAFVNLLLAPHLADYDLLAIPIIVATKRPAAGGKERGGVSSWRQVEGDIRRLLGDSNAIGVTTMIDLYGLPRDWPGIELAPSEPFQRVRYLESAMAAAIGNGRFVPYLSLHEFEALVLASASEAEAVSGKPGLGRLIEDDVAKAGKAELVNDSPQTAPSKRLNTYWPTYAKTTDGPRIVQLAGLMAIRSKCSHFNAWLDGLEVTSKP